MLSVADTVAVDTIAEISVTVTDNGSDGGKSVTATLTIDVVKPIDVTASGTAITLSEASAYAAQTDTGVTITVDLKQGQNLTGFAVTDPGSLSDPRFEIVEVVDPQDATNISYKLVVKANQTFDFEVDGGSLNLTVTVTAENANDNTDTSSGTATVTLTLDDLAEPEFVDVPTVAMPSRWRRMKRTAARFC